MKRVCGFLGVKIRVLIGNKYFILGPINVNLLLDVCSSSFSSWSAPLV